MMYRTDITCYSLKLNYMIKIIHLNFFYFYFIHLILVLFFFFKQLIEELVVIAPVMMAFVSGRPCWIINMNVTVIYLLNQILNSPVKTISTLNLKCVSFFHFLKGMLSKCSKIFLNKLKIMFLYKVLVIYFYLSFIMYIYLN